MARGLGQGLSFAALVQQLQLKGDRLHYKLLSGSGPEEGWVSVQLNGKPLAVQQQGGEQPGEQPVGHLEPFEPEGLGEVPALRGWWPADHHGRIQEGLGWPKKLI